jgi:ABC-type phosphate/phosphonate transport system substrate-binding protein
LKKNSSFIVKVIFALILTSFVYATAQVPNISQENVHKQKVVIGIRAFAGADMVYQEWNETINHLNKTIPNYEFKVLPLVDYEEIKNKVQNKDMDFYIGDPASYIEMESLYGMTRLATLQRKKDGLYFDKFGAVIFTASKNKDINTFADFKDKVLMGVSESAFAGYRIGYREMIMQGIKPEKVFKNILFSGGRGDDVVNEVLANENYVGIVRTGLVEAMIQQGTIKKEDIKIINSIDYSYFPLMVSTKLYPEFPFARLSHIPEELGKKVLISLLSIQEDSNAAKTGKYARWLIPNDYSDVTNLMKDLNVGIFKDLNKVTLEKVIQEYWLVISMIFVFIIVLIIFSIRIKIQETTIREHKDKLKKILDIQDSIVLLFDGKKILDCNLKLYQFFNISHLKEFSQRFINISDIFEESEFYLQKNTIVKYGMNI